MKISPEVSGAAFRLVRAAHARRLPGETIPMKDAPFIAGVLATLAAGLLADLADATGQDSEAMLDMLETKSMERLLT